MDIHSWIFMFDGHPWWNVLAWISLLGYQCGYPHLYGELKTDIQTSWISTWITVDFWKSMYGHAMDSWTTAANLNYRADGSVHPILQPFNNSSKK